MLSTMLWGGGIAGISSEKEVVAGENMGVNLGFFYYILNVFDRYGVWFDSGFWFY